MSKNADCNAQPTLPGSSTCTEVVPDGLPLLGDMARVSASVCSAGPIPSHRLVTLQLTDLHSFALNRTNSQ
jgi:hypothetical protein